MVRLAVSGNRFFQVREIESERKGCSYTIDTLRELSAGILSGEDLFFIMGSDAFIEVKLWKEYSELVRYASIVVIDRHGDEWDAVRAVIRDAFPEYEPDETAMRYRAPGRYSIILVNVTRLDISSTEIRKRLEEGKSVRYLLPEEVISYMKKNDIYILDKNKAEVSETSTPEYAAKRIAREIHNNKGQDIVVLDVRGISAFTDFLVIAHGRSSRHVQGIMGKIKRTLSREKIKCRSIEGDDEGKWILMDYEDSVVHLFYEPVREFYDLEGLWHEAPRLDWQGGSDMERPAGSND